MNQVLEFSLIKIIMPLIFHPNLWLRENTINFLMILLHKYDEIDIFCEL